MNRHTFVFFIAILFSTTVFASDPFSKVVCGADIVNALIGQKISNERVVVTENRHRDLALKNLGGDIVSNRLFASSWMICGSEFMLLSEGSTIRDVLKVPRHSKIQPLAMGQCDLNNHKVDVYFSILDRDDGKNLATLPAKFAWRVDEKAMKFVQLETSGMRCYRSDAITLDGGA
jgi:hypothetical protein